jgi:hypothetical protein
MSENPKYKPVRMGAEGDDPFQPLPRTTPSQRIEQMYELADIFACIFEAAPYEHEHAIATGREAA